MQKRKIRSNYTNPFIKGALTAAILMFTMSVLAQDSTQARQLTLEAFTQIVRSYHPMTKQAEIMVQMAKAARITARGGFDPTFYINSEQKTFDGKNYYQYTNPELKIPTWYGVEVKAGTENNGGTFLNSESSAGRSSYLGVSVPLAKNLLMDKRRAVLQQARLMVEQSYAERRLAINDLLFEANAAYWNWAVSYEVYRILTNAVAVNTTRFRLIRIGFQQGERAAIDTVEALAQLQNFQFLQSQALLEFNNSGVELSNYLWLANGNPYKLPATVLPDTAWSAVSLVQVKQGLLDELLYAAKLTHPKLSAIDFKLRSLEVERKLKFQSLLPTLNLKTNILNKGYNVFKGAGPSLWENNYKFGIDLGLPLRFSEGRGEYRRAKLKIQETGLQQSMVQLEIENKVRSYYNELTGLREQIQIYEQAVSNYQRLMRGEDLRFRVGESTLFLLNARENKVLETQQKLIELKAKFYKTLIGVSWAAGQLQ
jgi:outer membrane protein TolC